ncbi:hypothetical protein OPV22_010571 [Ensete ventricosum]|uniref:AWS domain-containing protein n=1 Tax=Ensete ventricosum TaxID=4639 RepID=A0AAV8PW12_ENSVE|nr:hypothetical protein OPV22_010571 [Ensete ventricosum]
MEKLVNGFAVLHLLTRSQYKEFQSKAYNTTKTVECPLNISGTLTCKHQCTIMHQDGRETCECMHACIDELNPLSDGGKHCSSCAKKRMVMNLQNIKKSSVMGNPKAIMVISGKEYPLESYSLIPQFSSIFRLLMIRPKALKFIQHSRKFVESA